MCPRDFGLILESKSKERSLAEIEKTFYETLATNRVFSSHNKSATAQEELVNKIENLTVEITNASASSTRLASSLNRMTLAAVAIALLAFALEVYKLFWASGT